ncbi:MAG: selenium cofactor biosynthesis protein YqeC [Desulfomonilaceae bacterium]
MGLIFSTTSELVSAFELDSGRGCIAIIGAGGKTTLMYALAKSLVKKGKRVISTTSTKIFPPNRDESPRLILIERMFPKTDQIMQKIQIEKHITIGLRIDEKSGKVLGINTEQLFSMLNLTDYLIIEADGAAGRPIKSPSLTEPVIPDFVDIVIPVIGLDSIFLLANHENVFRLEEFLGITGLTPGSTINVPAIVKLFSHPDGALRNVPINSRIKAFFNKLDKFENIELLSELVRCVLLTTRYEGFKDIISGSLKHKENKFRKYSLCSN